MSIIGILLCIWIIGIPFAIRMLYLHDPCDSNDIWGIVWPILLILGIIYIILSSGVEVLRRIRRYRERQLKKRENYRKLKEDAMEYRYYD